jgi:hypothetical protein
LATPNYQFEKRRKDLAKKAKKEEKRLRKLEKPTSEVTPHPDPAPVDTEEEGESPATT